MNRQLFNLEYNGAQEIVNAVGMIADDIDYTKWAPILPMAMRRLGSIIGNDVLNAICLLYQDLKEPELIVTAQKPVAFFAWSMMIPTLDVQHGVSGRQKKLGENEKGLTALQEYKDEQNILNIAYEATDALIEYLESGNYEFWLQSEAKQQAQSLLIRNKSDFDRYYTIGSHRLYFALVPIIQEIQEAEIAPIVGASRLDSLLHDNESKLSALMDQCRRPLALLTIKKAVERLPIEVIPDGIVQIQQVGNPKEKLKAEKEARRQVAESLGKDAAHYLQRLQDVIAEMDDDPTNDDLYIYRATLQSKGITF